VMMATPVPRLRTPGVIAAELGEPLHRVLYVLRTRDFIKPSATAGRLRLFDSQAVAMIRQALNEPQGQGQPPRQLAAKSEALRAMQAEGQKLADILKEYQAGFRPGFTRRVDAALAAWGMVAMGFERHEPPGDAQGRGVRVAGGAGTVAAGGD